MIYLWLFIAGFSLIIEVCFFPAFVFLFFSLGALAAASATLLSIEIQILIFVIVSILSILVLRQVLRRIFRRSGRKAEPVHHQHPMAGRRGIAVNGLSAGQYGRISAGGSFWTAVSDEDIEAGADVVVIESQYHGEHTLVVRALK